MRPPVFCRKSHTSRLAFRPSGATLLPLAEPTPSAMKTSTSSNFLRQLLAPLCAAILPPLLATSANAQDIVAGWDFQTTTTGGTAVLASPSTPTVFNANVGNGTLYLNGTEGSSSWAAATELAGFAGTAINASNGLTTTTTSPAALAVLGGTGNAANGKSVSFKFSMAGKKTSR